MTFIHFTSSFYCVLVWPFILCCCAVRVQSALFFSPPLPTAPSVRQPSHFDNSDKQSANLHSRFGDRPCSTSYQPTTTSRRTARCHTSRAGKAHGSHRSQASCHNTSPCDAHHCRRSSHANGTRSGRGCSASRCPPRPGRVACQCRPGSSARRAQALLCVQLCRLWQDVLQKLPSEGTRPHAHRRAAIRLPVGRLWAPILAFRRAVATSPDAHGREALLLSAVRSALHAQRSLG